MYLLLLVVNKKLEEVKLMFYDHLAEQSRAIHAVDFRLFLHTPIRPG